MLGQAPFDLHRAHGLAQLGAEAAALARLEQPGKLHGDGRPAGDDAAVAGELPGGAHRGERIDAVMPVEPLVLIGDQHPDQQRVGAVEICRQTPAAVGDGEGAQELAVAVDDRARQLRFGVERRRIPEVECGYRHHGRRHKQRGAGRTPCRRRRPGTKPADAGLCSLCYPQSGSHCPGPITSMRPISVRALRWGRYMSSTMAGGRA